MELGEGSLQLSGLQRERPTCDKGLRREELAQEGPLRGSEDLRVRAWTGQVGQAQVGYRM